MNVVGSIASFPFFTGQEPAPILALVASAAAFVIMALTSLILSRKKFSGGPASEDDEIPSRVEDNSNVAFLRIAIIVLLVFCSVGSLVLAIGVLRAFASVEDIWEFMKIAALAEAFALGYYRVIKKN